MFDVPILFIVFKRLAPTQKVFSQIRKIQPRQLFIAADGPRISVAGEAQQCNEVRDWILASVDWDCNVETRFLEQNVGCKYAVTNALKWFFSNVEAGIILEDDCYPDLSFFPYCEELLQKYADNTNIRMISGRNNITKYHSKKQSYYFTTGGGIWGWATWKREVEAFNADAIFPAERELYQKLLAFTKDPAESKLIAKEAQITASANYSAWGFQWGIQGKLNEQLAITPSVNMIANIGFDVDGTHVAEKRNDFAKLKTMPFPIQHPEKIEVSYELSKKIANFIILPAPPLNRVKVFIKRAIKSILPYGVVRLIQKRNIKTK